MKELKHVRFDITVQAPFVHRDHEKIFFTPLPNLPDTVEAEVFVSWKEDAYVISVPDETWPFVLTRGCHPSYRVEATPG